MPLITGVLKPEQFNAQTLAHLIHEAPVDLNLAAAVQRALDELVERGVLEAKREGEYPWTL